MSVVTQQQTVGYEEIPWHVEIDKIRQILPDLADIMEDWAPSKDFTLIRARYPFGADILERGVFNLPLPDGSVVPLSDSRIPKHIQEKLSYARMPLGILTNNSAEVYRELDDRIFSLVFFKPGLDFGIWEYFGCPTPYSVCSGARSLYMLPKITLSTSHKKLRREFGISLSPPKKSFEHWYTFKEMANHDDFGQSWYTEFLFIPQRWLHGHDKNPHFQRLRNLILEYGWAQSGYGRTKTLFELDWQILASTLLSKGVRSDPYITDTIKHLIYVCSGELPTMRPATDDQAGPIAAIQQAYIDIYGLREYVPTIMQPDSFMLDENSDPVYYSLQLPTLLEFEPRSRNALSTIDELREVMELVDYLTEEVQKVDLTLGQITLRDLINQVKFDFYHSNTFAYGTIKPSLQMPIDDPRLLSMPSPTPDRLFAAHCSFVKGCIRISKREQ